MTVKPVHRVWHVVESQVNLVLKSLSAKPQMFASLEHSIQQLFSFLSPRSKVPSSKYLSSPVLRMFTLPYLGSHKHEIALSVYLVHSSPDVFTILSRQCQ